MLRKPGKAGEEAHLWDASSADIIENDPTRLGENKFATRFAATAPEAAETDRVIDCELCGCLFVS